MGMAADELLVDAANHVMHVEGASVGADLRVEGDLLEHVTELLGEMDVIVLVDGVGDFVGLLDEVLGDGVVGLHLVPGAAVLPSQPPHDAHERIELVLPARSAGTGLYLGVHGRHRPGEPLRVGPLRIGHHGRGPLALPGGGGTPAVDGRGERARHHRRRHRARMEHAVREHDGVAGNRVVAVDEGHERVVAAEVGEHLSHPGEVVAAGTRLVLVGAPERREDVDGHLRKRPGEGVEIGVGVLADALGGLLVVPVVRAVGHDDRRGRVLAQPARPLERGGIEDVTGDGLVEKVEVERLGDAHRIGERGAPRHEALRDGVAEDEQVAAGGGGLERAVGGEVPHGDRHDVREVDAHLDRRMGRVVEDEVDAARDGRGGVGVAAHDHEVDAVDHAVSRVADVADAPHDGAEEGVVTVEVAHHAAVEGQLVAVGHEVDAHAGGCLRAVTPSKRVEGLELGS